MLNNSVKDYIFCENYIPKEVCQHTLDVLKDSKWVKHEWYANQTKTWHSNNDKELDVVFAPKDLQEQFLLYIVKAIDAYAKKFFIPQGTFVDCSEIRFNRYTLGTVMRPHIDHIHTCFDGTRKGIPILSVVGVLNKNYSGGEFIFDGKYRMELNTGDIMVFPSNFMYPHEITEITGGERYSFVAWVF